VLVRGGFTSKTVKPETTPFEPDLDNTSAGKHIQDIVHSLGAVSSAGIIRQGKRLLV
jgi:hypothetical protein